MALTVIVTGAGGPAGVAVIRALLAEGHRVVGADADRSAVGLRLAHDGAVLPRFDDPGFAAEVTSVARATNANALISTIAEEMAVLDRLRIPGVRTWLPGRRAIDNCVDKWAFAKALEGTGVPTPATNLGSTLGVPGPWIVKPRFGRGSRDVYAVATPAEVAFAVGRVEYPLVQTQAEGREFTVDALVDRDGQLAGATARWRVETRGGISTKGETFSDHRVTATVARVLRAVGLTGPANVQGFVGPDGPTIVEVNPRFSGGLPLSLAAGADFVGEYLRGVMGLPLRPERLVARDGVRMMRYFEEVFEG